MDFRVRLLLFLDKLDGFLLGHRFYRVCHWIASFPAWDRHHARVADLSNRTLKMPDPVFGENREWYWYDETWTSYNGPYRSEQKARNALMLYCLEYL